MGSATSVNSVNNVSDKCIVNGKSKQDIISTLREFNDEENPILHRIRYGRHFVMDDETNRKTKKGAAVTNGTIGTIGALSAAELGSVVGATIGVVGGPGGVVIGSIAGTAIGGLVTYDVTKKTHNKEMAKWDKTAWHHFIVIEYGKKLKGKYIKECHIENGWKYECFIRLDFSNKGYSLTRSNTADFWNIFEEERTEKRGHLDDSLFCMGSIETLIEAIKYTKSQYNVITNNCQHVAKHIWIKMSGIESGCIVE